MTIYKNVDDIIMYGTGTGGTGTGGTGTGGTGTGVTGDRGPQGPPGPPGPPGADGGEDSDSHLLFNYRIGLLEDAPKASIFYKSAELPLKDYVDGEMLTIVYTMDYGPLRIIMKARDTETGFIYTVNPGKDYGFNFRYRINFGLEIAVGNNGIWLMTNDGQARNILTHQRRDRFNIYAILEFIPFTSDLPQPTINQQAPTNDGSLDA